MTSWVPKLVVDRLPSVYLPFVLVLVATAGCASAPRVVPASEIPDLEAQVAAEPGNERASRLLAASLVEQRRCDAAIEVADRFPPTAYRPWPLLVQGRCLEAQGQFDIARSEYENYLDEHPDSDGAAAIRSQLLLLRERLAVGRMQGIDAGTLPVPEEDVVAVLPFVVSGPDQYQPLSRGLAAQTTSDLLLLDRFRLVSRDNVQAVIDELALASSPLADSTTTPRFGRVVQAGQLVDGAADVPEDGPVGLGGSVVAPDGQLASVDRLSGSLDDLLTLQKELVFDIAELLGYTVTEAERQRILQNGTTSLIAFLAYSRGLELSDRGQYAAAAAQFAEAARIDPGFGDAGDALEGTVGAAGFGDGLGGDGIVNSSPGIAEAADAVVGLDPVAGILTASTGDVAPTQGEQATGGTDPDSENPVVSIFQIPSPPGLSLGTVRIVVPIPGGGR